MGIEKKTETIMSVPPLPVEMDYGINHAKVWKDLKKKHHLVYKGEAKENVNLVYKGEKYKLVKC